MNDRILTPVPPSLPPHQQNLQNFPLVPPMFVPNPNGGGMNTGQPGMNMVQQQMMMMMQMQQAMLMGMSGAGGGNNGQGHGQGRGLAERVGGFADAAPLPPAPVGGEDPRAKRGRVSYRDLDEPGAGGEGGLPY